MPRLALRKGFTALGAHALLQLPHRGSQDAATPGRRQPPQRATQTATQGPARRIYVGKHGRSLTDPIATPDHLKGHTPSLTTDTPHSTLSTKDDTEVKLGVFLSNTQSRRAKLITAKRQQLTNHGLQWAE
jgi:hypothetical protein